MRLITVPPLSTETNGLHTYNLRTESLLGYACLKGLVVLLQERINALCLFHGVTSLSMITGVDDCSIGKAGTAYFFTRASKDL